MRLCGLCQFRADMICLECHEFYCWRHVLATRDAFGYRCTANSVQNHTFVPFYQEQGEPIVKATNPKDAKTEGTRFARLLARVFRRDNNASHQDITDLAQFLCMDVLGHRDGEIVIAWVGGFAYGITTPALKEPQGVTPEDLIQAVNTLKQIAPGKQG